MSRAILPLAVPALLAGPLFPWYFARLQDGDGSAVCLLGLGLLMLTLLGSYQREKANLIAAPTKIGSILVLLLAITFFYQVLPPVFVALLLLSGAGLVFPPWRQPGVVLATLCALPLHAALDFYLGHPLRWITAGGSQLLLRIVGLQTELQGVQLLWQGQTVSVDPPCSGLNSLWFAALTTSALVAQYRLTWLSSAKLAFTALTLSLLGNTLRASLLFVPEAKLITIPGWLHEGVGLVIFAVCLLLLNRHAERLPRSLQPLHEGKAPCHRALAISRCGLTFVGLAALLFFSRSILRKPIAARGSAPAFDLPGRFLTEVPLSPLEQQFAKNFPGTITCYHAGGVQGESETVIVRDVTTATRRLHPSSHCLQAQGYSVKDKTFTRDSAGTPWLTYRATRGPQTFTVREHITSFCTDQTWTDHGHWFWSNFFQSKTGPWRAVTIITPL